MLNFLNLLWDEIAKLDWLAVSTVALAAATFWMASLSKRGLDAEDKREKSRRTPFLLFDFSDGPEHENLGPSGFRHMQSKNELLVSGTINNVGNILAIDVKLDVYQFTSSAGNAINEIAKIPVCDALPAGGSLQWSRSIGTDDFTVEDGKYCSGVSGLFLALPPGQYFYFHVVFSCKNMDGEHFCSIYHMEYVVKNGTVTGTRIVFSRTVEKYEPDKQCPEESCAEIKKREESQSLSMAEIAPRDRI